MAARTVWKQYTTADETETTVRRFHAQGFVVLPSVLSAAEARRLRDHIERRFQDTIHAGPERDLVRGGVSLMRIFEYHEAFRDLLVLEPVVTLAERIVGADCHVIAQNALRTPPGRGIVNWHIDDELLFPFLSQFSAVPDNVPCYTLNAMVALSDIHDEQLGPTHVVAGRAT